MRILLTILTRSFPYHRFDSRSKGRASPETPNGASADWASDSAAFNEFSEEERGQLVLALDIIDLLPTCVWIASFFFSCQ